MLGSYGVLEGGLFYLRTRERVRDKARYAWYLLGHPLRRSVRIVTPNYRDRAVIALPRYVAFLYYFIRPIRLTAKYWHGTMDERSNAR
jgi:hypothetical protein